MIRRLLATLALALVPLAAAQPLASLLPAETFAALGTTGLTTHEALLDDFIAEFEARGVADAFIQMFGDLEEDTPDAETALPPSLEGLDALDVIGEDAWIAVSASQFNPIPAVTLLARMSPDATSALNSLVAEETGAPGVQELSEGGVTFWVLPLEMEDAPAQVVAYAQADGITMLSTNPDVLRGVLRRLSGSGEPGFTTTESYAASLGAIGDGTFYGFLDLGIAADLAAQFATPFAAGMGFGPQVERIQRALATAGVSAGVVRVQDDGLASTSITVPDPDAGDVALFNLITAEASYDPATLQFVPATALTVTAGYSDLSGWWNYLNDLIGSLPDMGIQSLDQALRDFVGIDLRSSFFDWTGTHLATITTGLADAAEPGVAADNLLGEQVYVIETIDPDAARQGLSSLLGNLSGTVSAFADPMGEAGGASIAQETIAGVPVDIYQITTGVEIATAVDGGYALIATSRDAMEAALSAAAGGADLPPLYADLLASAPAGARSVAMSDTRAVMEATAMQLASTIELSAGMGGASNLDFDAIAQASETLEGYLLFVASRLGGSVSWGEIVEQAIVTEGFTAISW